MQHDYFSSLDQSNSLFVALSLPFPSSMLKLSNVDMMRPTEQINDIGILTSNSVQFNFIDQFIITSLKSWSSKSLVQERSFHYLRL